ncbi:MAG: VOC family protein [Leucobacter sp.]
MIGRLKSVVLDCPNTEELAEFYQSVLGGRIEVGDDKDWVDLYIDEIGPRLSFQSSPGFVAPKWPSDDGDQQLHLDVAVEDLDEADAALLRLGARHIDTQQGFRVYLDPVGHPFCTIG